MIQNDTVFTIQYKPNNTKYVLDSILYGLFLYKVRIVTFFVRQVLYCYTHKYLSSTYHFEIVRVYVVVPFSNCTILNNVQTPFSTILYSVITKTCTITKVYFLWEWIFHFSVCEKMENGYFLCVNGNKMDYVGMK